MKSSVGERFKEDPVNLTWVVIFTLIICSASILLDDIFFGTGDSKNLVSSDVGSEGRFSSIWFDIKSARGVSSDGTIQDDSNTFSFQITARTVQENRDAVHSGAIVLSFAVVAIWCISAYITFVEIGNLVNMRRKECEEEECIHTSLKV